MSRESYLVQATKAIPEFKDISERFFRKYTIAGKSESCTRNYSHRVAISNARILQVTDTEVTFAWRNRNQNYRQEISTISGVAFLKRFLEHIVPPGFRRIRHLGFLSSRNKTKSLEAIRKSLNVAHIDCKRTRAEVLDLRFGSRSLLQCKA